MNPLKNFLIALALACVGISAAANSCGVPPMAPDGMRFVCVCSFGFDGNYTCNWVLISRLSQFYDWELV